MNARRYVDTVRASMLAMVPSVQVWETSTGGNCRAIIVTAASELGKAESYPHVLITDADADVPSYGDDATGEVLAYLYTGDDSSDGVEVYYANVAGEVWEPVTSMDAIVPALSTAVLDALGVLDKCAYCGVGAPWDHAELCPEGAIAAGDYSDIDDAVTAAYDALMARGHRAQADAWTEVRTAERARRESVTLTLTFTVPAATSSDDIISDIVADVVAQLGDSHSDGAVGRIDVRDISSSVTR